MILKKLLDNFFTKHSNSIVYISCSNINKLQNLCVSLLSEIFEVFHFDISSKDFNE